jgi:hypothetical protein
MEKISGSEIRDEHPGSYFRDLETIFLLKILFFDADSDSGWKISVRYKHPGSATPYCTVPYLYLIQEALLSSCGPWGKVGFSKAMSAGWIHIDKSGTVPEMN